DPAARAAIFFRLVLTAGHAQVAPTAAPLDNRVSSLLDRPAQRHPSFDCGGRADAAAARRVQPRLGGGVGGDAPHLRLHQPYPVAGGAGEVAAADFPGIAAAPPAD